MDTLKASNLSLLAIPAYYVLSFLPHAYALNIATKGHPEKWDNTCPRSTTLKEKIKSQLSPAEFARYERAEACSANLYENLPLFASAIIVGNMAGLNREGWEGLNTFAAAYLGVRAIYVLAYIGIGSSAPSYIRSGLWGASIALCFRVFVQASKVLGVKGA